MVKRKAHNRKFNLSKEELYNLYWKEELNLRQIAKKLGSAIPTIFKWMKRYGIKIRKERGRQKINITKIELYDLYWKEELNLSKIANKYNCTKQTIWSKMKQYKIRRRTRTEYRLGKHGIYSKKTIEKMRKTKKKPENIKRFNELMSKPEIIEKRIKKLKGKNKGEKNWNWQGGVSFEPYGQEFNKELKEKIRKRDNYECQECSIKQEELKRKLDAHHIDYNKKNNNPLNLISLCQKCHLKTNGNRKHWKRYFQMQMFIREFFNPENILIFNENKQLIGLEKI